MTFLSLQTLGLFNVDRVERWLWSEPSLFRFSFGLYHFEHVSHNNTTEAQGQTDAVVSISDSVQQAELDLAKDSFVYEVPPKKDDLKAQAKWTTHSHHISTSMRY
jgi:hypothetical protein